MKILPLAEYRRQTEGPQLFDGCVSIQGLQPPKDAFENRLRHSGASRLSNFEDSFKCSLLFTDLKDPLAGSFKSVT